MKFKLYVFACIVLSVLIIHQFSVAAINISTKVDSSSKIVVIDAGHGGEDGGAVGWYDVQEKDINLEIALILQELYLSSGYEVIMIRDGDYAVGDETLSTVSERKVSDIKTRAEIINNSGADMVISIHQNYFTEAQYSGAQMFYGTVSGSTELAQNIQDEIVLEIQPQNEREIKAGDTSIYLLNNVNVPIVIAECGFISNEDETLNLMDEDYLKQMAFCIFLGSTMTI